MEKNISGIWFGKMEFDKILYREEFERLLKEKRTDNFLSKKAPMLLRLRGS